jgi:hypothetical protein
MRAQAIGRQVNETLISGASGAISTQFPPSRGLHFNVTIVYFRWDKGIHGAQRLDILLQAFFDYLYQRQGMGHKGEHHRPHAAGAFHRQAHPAVNLLFITIGRRGDKLKRKLLV